MISTKSIYLKVCLILMLWSANSYAQDCQSATEIYIGACQFGTIEGTSFTGDLPTCHTDNQSNVGSSWHYFVAPPSGLVTLKSNAEFNDVLTLYSGSSCNQMFQLRCENEDEYGFRGERINLALSGGQQYYIRVSGSVNDHSPSAGEYCIELTAGSSITPTPINDDCSTPKIVIVDGNPGGFTEHNENTEIEVHPARNLKSRSSLWYKFLAPSDGDFRVTTNASFADVIVVYNSDCNNLTEIVSEVDGYGLKVSDLSMNNEYLIQVTGYFAGLSGPLTVDVKSMPSAPANDNCADGSYLTINDECISGTFYGANPTEGISDCTVYQGPGVWYVFLAPVSQNVFIDIDSDYPYNAALYSGPCADREELWCASSASACDETPVINNLQPNFVYYLYVSASPEFYNPESDFCIRLSDGVAGAPTNPLSAEPVLTCYADGSSELTVNISGGTSPYTQYGIQNGALLYYAEKFEYTVMDAKGCGVNVVQVSNCHNIEDQCPKVSDLEVVTVGDNSATISWLANTLTTSYTVRFKPVSSNHWTKITSSNTVSFISSLLSCTAYELQVSGDCGLIGSGYTESIYFTTENCAVCSSPVSSFEFNVTGTSAIVTWDVSVGVDSYILNHRKVGSSTWSVNETSYPLAILFGLSSCSNYEYFVESSCGGLTAAAISNHSFSTLSCKGEDESISALTASIDIFPNPATDEINISFNSLISEAYLISLYSIDGKIVHSEIVKEETSDLKLKVEDLNISAGIYRLEVSNATSSISEKIVIQ